MDDDDREEEKAVTPSTQLLKEDEDEDDSWLYEPTFKKRAPTPILISDEEEEEEVYEIHKLQSCAPVPLVAAAAVMTKKRPPLLGCVTTQRGSLLQPKHLIQTLPIAQPKRSVQTLPITPTKPKRPVEILIDNEELVELSEHSNILVAEQMQEAHNRRLKAPYWNEMLSGEVIMDVDFAVRKVGVIITQQTCVQTHPIVIHFWDNIDLAPRQIPTTEELVDYYRVDARFTQVATHEQWRVRDALMRRRLHWLQVEFEVRREPWRTAMKKEMERRMRAYTKLHGASHVQEYRTFAHWLTNHGTQDERARWHTLDGEISNVKKRKQFFMRRHLFGPLSSPPPSPVWDAEAEAAALDALQTDLEALQQQIAAAVVVPKQRKRKSSGVVDGEEDTPTSVWMQPLHPSLARWVCTDERYWYQPAIDTAAEKAAQAPIQGNTAVRVKQMQSTLAVYAQFWARHLGVRQINEIHIEKQDIKFGAEGAVYEAAMNMFFATTWPTTRPRTINAIHKLKVVPLNPEHIQTLMSNDAWNASYWHSLTPGNALVVRQFFPASSKRRKRARDVINEFWESHFTPKRWLKKREEEEDEQDGDNETIAVVPSSSVEKKCVTEKKSSSSSNTTPSAANKAKQQDFFATRHLSGRARYAVQSQQRKQQLASKDTTTTLTDEPPTKNRRKRKRNAQAEEAPKRTGVAYGHTATADESARRIANKKEAVARCTCIVEERFDWDMLGVVWKSRYDWMWNNEDRRDAADAMLQMLSQRIPHINDNNDVVDD